jgi:hypothetical protein
MWHRLGDWLWNLQGLTCREAMRLSARAMDAPLHPCDRAAVWLHNHLCDCCRAYAKQIRLLRRWMWHMGQRDALPEKAGLSHSQAQRIKAALRREEP